MWRFTSNPILQNVQKATHTGKNIVLMSMPPRKIYRLDMKGAPGVPYTSRSVSSQVVVYDHGPTAMPSPPKLPPGINTVSAWNGFQRVVNDSEPHDGGVVGRTFPRFLWVGRWVHVAGRLDCSWQTVSSRFSSNATANLTGLRVTGDRIYSDVPFRLLLDVGGTR